MISKIQVQINDALDTLRHATVNRDITRADKLKAALLKYLEPAGYTLVEDSKLIYVIEKVRDKEVIE